MIYSCFAGEFSTRGRSRNLVGSVNCVFITIDDPSHCLSKRIRRCRRRNSHVVLYANLQPGVEFSASRDENEEYPRIINRLARPMSVNYGRSTAKCPPVGHLVPIKRCPGIEASHRLDVSCFTTAGTGPRTGETVASSSSRSDSILRRRAARL